MNKFLRGQPSVMACALLYTAYTSANREPMMYAQSPMQSPYRESTPLLYPLFRPVILPLDLIGHPAPCDIFSARGTLVVKTGAVISQRAHDLMQPQHVFCQAEQAHYISTLDPINHGNRAVQERPLIVGRIRPNRNTKLAVLLYGRRRSVICSHH